MKRNTAYLLSARLISAATTLAVLSYVGHSRGGAALGVVGVGMAIGALLSAATDTGTTSLLIREGARDPRQLGRLLVAMSAWRIVVLPLAAAILWVLIGATISTEPRAVFLVAMGLAVQQFAELTRAVFIARQEMHISSAHSVIENTLWLLVTVGMLIGGASLEAAFTAGLSVFVVSTIIGFIVAVSFGTGGLQLPDGSHVGRLVRFAGPFAAFMVVGVAYSRIDVLLIGALIPVGALAAAGAYFSVMRLLAGLEYLPEAVARASYPKLAYAFQLGPERLARELRPAASFLVIVAAPVPFLMLVAGPWIVTAVFGPDVAPYAWMAVPLGAVMPLRWLGQLFGMTLTSTNAQGRRALAVLLALAVVVVLDIILIPPLGVTGAVIASVVASLTIFVTYALQVLRLVGGLGLVPLIARCFPLAGALGIAGTLLAPSVGRPIGAILMILAYGVGLLVLGHLRMPARLTRPV